MINAGFNPNESKATLPGWDELWSQRNEISSELQNLSVSLPADDKRNLCCLSRWFGGDHDVKEVLFRPDLLAICVPLMEGERKQPSNLDIANAARRGFCSISQRHSSMQRTVRLFYYPLLVLAGYLTLLAIGAFTVIPDFEDLFDEFGIDVPQLTDALFWLSQLFRRWWWLMAAIPAFVLATFWYLEYQSRQLRPVNITWLDRRFMSTRNAIAVWAWHTSLLLRAGVSEANAISIANQAIDRSDIQRMTDPSPSLNSASPIDASASSEFRPPKFRLLQFALQTTDLQAKIALLDEVSRSYQDRSRNLGDWWVHWLVSLTIWFIGATLALIITALLSPLIAIISGLMGN